MNEFHPAKQRAAAAAAALVEPGMAVGLGSGTTANLVIEYLGRRVADEGLVFLGVATSTATADLARSVGIPLKDLDEVDVLDINLDGADEVDPRFQLIKGRGGALLREKIVVTVSRRRVTIVTAEKCVDPLGSTMPIPVEVAAFGLRHTAAHLGAFAAEATIRLLPDGSRFVSDGGNAVVDCRFPRIDDPSAIDRRLRQVPGVFETGLFLGLCDLLIVGHPDRVERIEGRGRSETAPAAAGST